MSQRRTLVSERQRHSERNQRILKVSTPAGRRPWLLQRERLHPPASPFKSAASYTQPQGVPDDRRSGLQRAVGRLAREASMNTRVVSEYNEYLILTGGDKAAAASLMLAAVLRECQPVAIRSPADQASLAKPRIAKQG